MAFSILEHLAKLEPTHYAGKYTFPARRCTALSVNEGTGDYNVYHSENSNDTAENR